MTDFLQNDPKWKDLVYQSGLTYGDDACFIVSLGNLVNLDPPTCAAKLIAGGGLVDGNVVSDKAAEILGLVYNGISTTKPSYDCIAMTNYYEAKYHSKHFFIVKADGSQQDPLGFNIKYPIVNYRLFEAKGVSMSMGFDDNNVQGIIRETLRIARQEMLGSVDETGLEADVTDIFPHIQNGELDPIGKKLQSYETASDMKWCLKTDCPLETVCPECPPTVCPPCAIACPPCPPLANQTTTMPTGTSTTAPSNTTIVTVKESFLQTVEEWYDKHFK